MVRGIDESLVGLTVGAFTLTRKLGEGAMGVVFEARSSAGDRAAVKVVKPELLASPEHRARFQREAKTLERIDHPNVVRFLDVGEEDGLVYLALELVEGETLDERIKRVKRLGTADATRLAIDLFRGLAAIHEQGVVHRDVKPQNIIISGGGVWKIADFGLARRDAGEESIVLTAPGTVLGTPHYMSPEQGRGDPLDARSDLYSAGATLYHAIAGEPVFPKSSVMAILAAHMDSEPPDLASKVPTAPRELSKLIRRCLAKEPRERPASAREALLALGIKEAGERRPSRAPTRASGEVAALAAAQVADPPAAPSPGAPRFSTNRVQANTVVPPAAFKASSAPPPPAVDGSSSQRVPQVPVHVRPRWGKAVLPGLAAIVLGAAKVTLELKPPELPQWLAALGKGIAQLPPAVRAFVSTESVVGFVGAYAVFLVPLLAAIALVRVLAAYVRANAPPDAKVRSFVGRSILRIRAIRAEKTDPRAAADALRDLGEPQEAADLLLSSGLGVEAAEEYVRQRNFVAAGQIFEQVKEHVRAIEAFVAAGQYERAARVAQSIQRWEDAGQLFARARATDKAVEAFRRAGKPVAAAQALEDVGKLQEAAQEIATGLKEGKALKRGATAEDRKQLVRRAADLYERAGKGLLAAPLYEEAGDPARALKLYERHGNYEAAGRIALAFKDHERAADLLRRGRKPVEAARARAEGLLARGETLEAARALEEGNDVERAADLYEQADANADAGRCFEALGDVSRAADLYARGGDHAKAARLYERSQSWREAALSWREVGDQKACARCHERCDDALAAADAFVAANEPDEAARVLSKVTTMSSQWRDARARLGDLHAAAGRDGEAAKAYADGLKPDAPIDKESAPRLLRQAGVLANLGRDSDALAVLARFRTSPFRPEDLEARIAGLEARARRPHTPRPAPTPAKAAPRPARPEPPRPAPTRAGVDPRSLVGTEVDRYRLLALVGEGSLAWVFKAEHTFLRRTVAFKLLKPRPGDPAEITRRFLDEERAIAAIKHPNVVDVQDVGVTPTGSLWIAFELVPGGSLRELLKQRGTIPVPQAARIAAGTLAGLSAGHAAGIVHGDLDPENVLIAPNDRARVTDFGIAKALAAGAGTEGRSLATPRYLSPEQALGHEATPASDQYAAGVVLYEMLTGKAPFEAPRHAGPPPPLLAKAPHVPEKLAEAVLRALETDPEARFPSCEALRKAVVPFAPRAPGPSQSTSGD